MTQNVFSPPAFPSEQGETQDGTWNQTYSQGISRRDYFAAKSLQGCLAYSHVNQMSGNWQENCSLDALATHCYAMADAMEAASGEAIYEPEGQAKRIDDLNREIAQLRELVKSLVSKLVSEEDDDEDLSKLVNTLKQIEPEHETKA